MRTPEIVGPNRRLATVQPADVPPADLSALNLLTAAEVAEVARVHPDTVYNAVAQGRLLALRPTIRIVRFRPEDVADWLGLPGALDGVLEWIAARDAHRTAPLCPACGAREQSPQGDGLCAPCAQQQRLAADEAAERDRERKRRYWNSEKGRQANERRTAARAARRQEGGADAQP